MDLSDKLQASDSPMRRNLAKPGDTGVAAGGAGVAAASDGAGVGLGLAIARGFTEAMHGTISLEDTPGGGLIAVVALPIAQRT